MRDYLAERAKSGENRQELLDAILAIVADPTVPDEDVGGLIRGERIGWDRLRSAQSSALPPLPRDHGHLAALDGSYGYLRQFTPQVLDAVAFAGGTAAAELLEAVAILRELNATGARKVPDDAPTGFVPTRWRGYLETAAANGSATAYRHYWELVVLLALRDGLRTGDVFVPGSRRYSDPAAYLLTEDKWAAQREEFCRLVGKPADAAQGLADAEGELHAALGELEATLGAGDGPVRLDGDGDLVISPLTAEDVPGEALALKAELTEMLPFAPIVSLLIEMDKRTGFLDCFINHLEVVGGAAEPQWPGRPPRVQRGETVTRLHLRRIGFRSIEDDLDTTGRTVTRSSASSTRSSRPDTISPPRTPEPGLKQPDNAAPANQDAPKS